jgi:hypothetical protein
MESDGGYAEARKLATELLDNQLRPTAALSEKLLNSALRAPPDRVQRILRDDAPGKWSMREKHIVRWVAVCEELDRNGWTGRQYEDAGKRLMGHPAHAGPDAMKLSFDFVQKYAHPGMARPRMHRKRALGRVSLG